MGTYRHTRGIIVAYFWIEYGLRGAYADGNGFIVQANTRKELRAIIESEARSIDGRGASKRMISWLANAAWGRHMGRNSGYLPYVLPIKPAGCSSYSWGIYCDVSSRKDYSDYLKHNC